MPASQTAIIAPPDLAYDSGEVADCARCGVGFRTSQGVGGCCSPRCLRALARNSHYQRPPCEHCGAEVPPRKRGGPKKYCSRRCQQLAWQQAQRGGKRKEVAMHPHARRATGPPSLPGAVCASGKHPPELWFATSAPEREKAVHLCEACPCLTACRSWAITSCTSPSGVVGGLTSTQRRSLRLARLATTREAS